MTAACIGDHGDDRPLPEPGLLLCAWHRRGLGNDLAHLAALWPLLEEMLTVSNGLSGGASGKPGSRPPCNLTITDITDPRGTVAAQIGGWARIVVEERQLSAAPADIHAAVRLLAIHADWVAAQPWADEACAEIHDAAMTVRRACRDLERRWVVGTCAMPSDDGQPCGGDLHVEVQHVQSWQADRDDYDRRSTIRLVCRTCGDTWTEADLDGYMIVNDVWLPIDDAAYQLGVSRRTLNRHAATGKVRRRRGMVSWSDARRTVAGG